MKSRPWWEGLAPVSIGVRCGGHPHELRWEAGKLQALDHDDVERERALAALGGESVRCLDVLDGWIRHSDDLAVLLLARRGLTDELRWDDEAEEIGFSSYAPRAMVRRGRQFLGWYAYSPGGPIVDETPSGTDRQLRMLMRLDRGIPDRLAATVISAWAQRVEADDDRVAAARPQLKAALYGRLATTLRMWLGHPARLNLTMVEPETVPTALVSKDAVHVTVGFTWLRDVWMKGFATMFGRLCLRATVVEEGHWELLTVAADGSAPRMMTVELK